MGDVGVLHPQNPYPIFPRFPYDVCVRVHVHVHCSPTLSNPTHTYDVCHRRWVWSGTPNPSTRQLMGVSGHFCHKQWVMLSLNPHPPFFPQSNPTSDVCHCTSVYVLQAVGDVRDPNPIHPHFPCGPFATPACLPAAAALWITQKNLGGADPAPLHHLTLSKMA